MTNSTYRSLFDVCQAVLFTGFEEQYRSSISTSSTRPARPVNVGIHVLIKQASTIISDAMYRSVQI